MWGLFRNRTGNEGEKTPLTRSSGAAAADVCRLMDDIVDHRIPRMLLKFMNDGFFVSWPGPITSTSLALERAILVFCGALSRSANNNNKIQFQGI